jgi:Inositol monophosphatase family
MLTMSITIQRNYPLTRDYRMQGKGNDTSVSPYLIFADAVASSVWVSFGVLSERLMEHCKLMLPMLRMTSDKIVVTINQLQRNSKDLEMDSVVAGVLACSVSALVSGLSAYVYYQTKAAKKEIVIQHPHNVISIPIQQPHIAIPPPLVSSPHIREIEVAIQLVTDCGNRLYQYYGTNNTVMELSQGSDTKFDPEDFFIHLVDGLKQEFPTHTIIDEASLSSERCFSTVTHIPTWVVDPIDDTTTNKLPLACVSIGYFIHGKPILGLVYTPMTAELYLGVAGHGTYCNGIQISQKPEFTCVVEKSLVSDLHMLVYDATKDTNCLMEI